MKIDNQDSQETWRIVVQGGKYKIISDDEKTTVFTFAANGIIYTDKIVAEIEMLKMDIQVNGCMEAEGELEYLKETKPEYFL